MYGRFITFEGGEGSGKSTQARLLCEALAARGICVLATREPGGSPFAEALREIIMSPAHPTSSPLAEALLFSAARADHLDATIRPALRVGRWVVCDRFADSTRVYQGAAGGLEAGHIEELEAMVVGQTRPELTLLLDIDAATGLARARARYGASAAIAPGAQKAGTSATQASSPEVDIFESRQIAFHEALRAGYLAIARAEPERVAVIDASAPPAVVQAAIWALVETRFGPF